MTMEVDIFAQARTRLQAYRLARDFIQAEDSEPLLLIEAQAVEDEVESTS